jgi:transmembrane sensor
MTKDEFQLLYQKFLKGACTQEEIIQLHAYQDEIQLENDEWEQQAGDQGQVYQEIRARLQQSIAQTNKEVIYRRLPSWRLWSAAAILTGLAFGIYYVYEFRRPVVTPAPPMAEKQPSSGNELEKKTYLTLSNGQKISLTDAAKGTVTTTSGIVASKQGDGWLTYATGAGPEKPAIPDTNSISTPHGEKFSITLADGSKVWLNAATSLRFPVYFTTNKREVYLSGEACFEVKADLSKPFIVHVNGIAVQATGTMFNIKSYTEERSTMTTLLSGTVHLQLPATEKVLKPGQQLLFDDENGRARMQAANASTVLAWREGLFSFENEPIADIMHEIGRWYNKKIIFVQGDISRRFTVSRLQRNESLDEVLKSLELTGGLQFKTTNREIMVTVP